MQTTGNQAIGAKDWAAWQDEGHSVAFNFRAALSDADLRRDYEQFNEFALLQQAADDVVGTGFAEVGCATGELHRYLRRVHPHLQYAGFDVSGPAIALARKRFPGASFTQTSPDLSVVKARVQEPAIVWSRDVAQHQSDPFAFVSSLLDLGAERTIIRLRTRDVGDTVMDVERSCQWHCGSWVPFIMVNTDQLVQAIVSRGDIARLTVMRRHEVLGGQHGRFVPKDCYDPATGTAETAIMAERGDPGSEGAIVDIIDRDDTPQPGPLWRRGVRSARRRLQQIRKR